MGADDMYDVVKFRVGIPGKKVTALTLAAVAPAAGADVYLLPYSTQKDRSFTAGKVRKLIRFPATIPIIRSICV